MSTVDPGEVFDPNEKLWTPEEVAAHFSVTPIIVTKWMRNKDNFPRAFKVGNRWRIPDGDIRNFVSMMYGKGKR